MTDQLDLGLRGPDRENGGPVREPKPLTERQTFVWHLVRSSSEGMTTEQVGAALHAQKGTHPFNEPCEWCPRDGRSVLISKAVSPLVTYRVRADGVRRYIARSPEDRATVNVNGQEPTEAELAANPFAGL